MTCHRSHRPPWCLVRGGYTSVRTQEVASLGSPWRLGTTHAVLSRKACGPRCDSRHPCGFNGATLSHLKSLSVGSGLLESQTFPCLFLLGGGGFPFGLLSLISSLRKSLFLTPLLRGCGHTVSQMDGQIFSNLTNKPCLPFWKSRCSQGMALLKFYLILQFQEKRKGAATHVLGRWSMWGGAKDTSSSRRQTWVIIGQTWLHS